MRFRVGERPAGAVEGVFEMVVFNLGVGERAWSIGRRGLALDLSVAEKSLGEGGALVRKKLTGF